MFKFQAVMYGRGEWNGYLILDENGKEKHIGGLNIDQNTVCIRTKEEIKSKQLILLLSQLSEHDTSIMDKNIEIVKLGDDE
jgi:hypothetical protein